MTYKVFVLLLFQFAFPIRLNVVGLKHGGFDLLTISYMKLCFHIRKKTLLVVHVGNPVSLPSLVIQDVKIFYITLSGK